MLELNKIYEGDALPVLKTWPSNFIHCGVTSPAYWGLRDYGTAQWEGGDPKCDHKVRTDPHTESSTLGGGKSTTGHQKEGFKEACGRCGARRIDDQLGLEKTPGEYIARVVKIFREFRRCLRDDGTLWLNLGDSYAGSWGDSGHRPDRTGVAGHQRKKNSKWLKREGHPKMNKPPTVSPPGLKPKNLVGIPWLVVFALQADGWTLRSDIIWSKSNPMPESVEDRPSKSHEYFFLLTKSNESQYWTHRDFKGTRECPGPDYRWINGTTNEETAQEPDNWNTTRIQCPDCKGKGYVGVKFETGLFGETETGHRTECERCEDSDDHTILEWERINLWKGHDYYYDSEAIREQATYGDHPRKGVPGTKVIAPGQAKHTGFSEIRSRGTGAQPPAWSNPNNGRNRRTVWEVATQSYSGAHFAVFPEKLIEPSILAGTSEKECCEKCGAPWERKTRPTDIINTSCKGNYLNKGKTAVHQENRAQEGKRYLSRTAGWMPTCQCKDAGTKPCIVADIFMGAGTTALVACKFNRSFLGIDLNKDYIKMAEKRIAHEKAQLKIF